MATNIVSPYNRSVADTSASTEEEPRQTKRKELPFVLRQPSQTFTGSGHNKQLRDIASNFEAHVQKHVEKPPMFVQILCGLGGCGKTEIVTQYVWNNWRMYDHVFIIRGLSNAYINYGLQELIEKTTENPDEIIDLSPNEVRNRSLEWLRTHKKWLLVIEDADDPSLIKHILPNNPVIYHGHVLITTRLSNGWGDWYTDWRRKTRVNVLSTYDSAIFLLRAKRSSNGSEQISVDEAERNLENLKTDDKEEYDALMWLGDSGGLHGLPIALLQAIQYISALQITFAKYKELYEMCDTEVLRHVLSDPLEGWLKANRLDPGFAPVLRSEFKGDLLSLKTLQDDVSLAERLRQGHIHMSDKDIELLKNACKVTKESVFSQMENPDKGHVLTTWKLSYEALCEEKVVAEFLHLCCCLAPCIDIAMLVEGARHFHPGDLRSFCIGRRSFRMTQEETYALKAIHELISKLSKYSFSSMMIGQSSVSRETHQRSLTRLGTFSVHHIVQVVIFKLAKTEEKIHSLNNAISMLENLFPKLEEVQADQIEVLCDDTFGGRHSVIASHTLALARQIQALEEDDVQGLDDVNKLFSVVAVYFRRMELTDEAKVLYRVLARLSMWQKPIREDYLAEVMRNIGKVNFDMKNFEEAKSNFEKSIELFTKVYGKEDPHVFYAMQGLGRVLHYAMETEAQSKEVEKHLLETLRRKEKYFRNREPGELDNYSIAHAMQQLGRYYQKVEDYEKAHHYFNESLEKKKRNWQRKYGTTKTVDIAVDMTNLARNYLLKDGVNRDLHEAEKLLEEAYDIKRGKMLPKNESCQLAMYYLAVLYHEKQDTEKSEQYQGEIVLPYLKELYETLKLTPMCHKKVYPPEKTFWL